MPARKHNRQVKKKYSRWIIVIILLSIVSVGLLLYRGRSWRGNSKLNLVIPGPEAIYIAVFNPQEKTLQTIKIPITTEVEASRALGKWKLGSIWQLGKNEGYGGRLLAETMVKNFKIPVTYWADLPALVFIRKGNPLPAVFGRYDTNLTLADRLGLWFFSLQIREFKITNLNLADTAFLKEKKLTDGQMGYVVTKTMPENLLIIASDNLLANDNLKINLINVSGNNALAAKIGEIVEAMGAKIAFVQNSEREDVDCTVAAKEAAVASVFARVFSCEIETPTTDLNFDVALKFGSKFAKRF